MEQWDFFKLRKQPKNIVEQQLFWDYQYYPDDIAELWGVTVKELDMIFREPYTRMTPRYIEDIASMTDLSRVDILLEFCVPEFKNVKSETEFMKFIQMKNRL